MPLSPTDKLNNSNAATVRHALALQAIAPEQPLSVVLRHAEQVVPLAYENEQPRASRASASPRPVTGTTRMATYDGTLPGWAESEQAGQEARRQAYRQARAEAAVEVPLAGQERSTQSSRRTALARALRASFTHGPGVGLAVYRWERL